MIYSCEEKKYVHVTPCQVEGGDDVGGGGGVDVGESSSSPLSSACGSPACLTESVKGERRRTLPGVHGNLSRARSDGAAALPSASVPDNQGGVSVDAADSISNIKTGFSFSAKCKKNKKMLEMAKPLH